MKANQSVLVAKILFRRNFDGMLLRCVDAIKAQRLMEEFHEGIFGGNFSPISNTHRIMRDIYYWPIIFKDSYSMIRKCISCQKISGKNKMETMPMQPISIEEPFTQWGLDVIGLINPKSSKGHSYILTTTNYFTKWQEAVALKKVDSYELIRFLKENILAIFGVPDFFYHR
jgi:hypothetical protein